MIIDKEKVKRSLFLTPCKDRQALGNWFKVFLGVELFSDITSRFASSSPLDAAWEIYSHCLYPVGRKPERFLFASARSTQKTLLLAAVELAIIVHDRRSALHFAASVDQADNAYRYFKEFCRKTYVRDILQSEPTSDMATFNIPKYDDPLWLKGLSAAQMEQEFKRLEESGVRVDIDSRLRLVTMEILPITPMSVQGRHLPMVSKDETHTLKGEKLAAYNDITKIPIPSADSKPYVTFDISSRKSPNSIVEKQIQEKDKTGLKVRTWTMLEGTEQCPDSRSGTDFEHERYVNVIKGKIIGKEEFDFLDDRHKEDYQRVDFASKCLECPIASVCLTDLKKPKAKNKRLGHIESVIVDYTGSVNREWFLAQCMSMQPSKEGLVFPSYDERTHFVDANMMYQAFTGEKPTKNWDSISLGRLFKQKGLKAHLGLDHGFSHPFGCSLHFTDGKDRVFTIFSFKKSGMDINKDIIPLLRKLELMYGKYTIHPDPARPDLNSMIATAGFVISEVVKETDVSVDIVRGFLEVKNGKPSWIMLSPDCDDLNKEMQRYQYVMSSDGTYGEDIVKKEDDIVDGVRYFYLNNFNYEDRKIIVATDHQNSKTNELMTLANVPLPEPMADFQGRSGNFAWSFGNDEE